MSRVKLTLVGVSISIPIGVRIRECTKSILGDKGLNPKDEWLVLFH